MKNFSEKLKYYRKMVGLSQTSLAQKIGITPTQVSKYERGLAEPRPEILKKISEALNITIDKLLSEEKKTQVNTSSQFLDTLAKLQIAARRIKKNGMPDSTRYMDCYLSPETDLEFINEAKNLFYNYIKNRFGDNHDMAEILRTYNLLDIRLEYNLLDDNNSN